MEFDFQLRLALHVTRRIFKSCTFRLHLTVLSGPKIQTPGRENKRDGSV